MCPSAIGRGPPPEDLTQAEELALTSNRGWPLVEGIEGGTSSGYVLKSVWDQCVEGIDYFPSKCQSLNYNN